MARSVDHPSHRLISNKALLHLVKTLPRRPKQLYGIHGLPAWVVRRNGDEIIEAVKHGLSSRLQIIRPNQEPIPPEIVERYTALHTWRKQTANSRGVESDVIISRDALWDIARCNPATINELCGIRGLGPWRRKTYGSALVAVLNGSS